MGRNPTNPSLDYFEYNVGDNESTCKLCKKTLTGKHGTNLEKHIKSFHPEIFEKIVKTKNQREDKSQQLSKRQGEKSENDIPTKKQLKMSDIFESTTVNVKLNAELLKNACLEIVTVNGRPFKILEDSGFKKIIEPIQAAFKTNKRINSQNIREDIPVKASELREQITTELKNKIISLKVDAATRMSRSFLGINAQFMIDNKIALRTLAVQELRQSHTGLYLKNVIIDSLKLFGVSIKQIYTVTCDNGANMLKSIDLIRDELVQNNNLIDEVFGDAEDDVSEELMASLYDAMKLLEAERLNTEDYMGNTGILQTIRCGAHTMQLAVFDCLKKDKAIEKTLSKAREIVKKLRTPTMSMILKV